MIELNRVRLLDLMLERPIGVNALAKACGFAQATVSDLLNGKRRASIPTVVKLAGFFGVKPRELILTETKGAN